LDDESLRAELESLDIEEAAAEERVERRGRTGNETPPP
jgi:CPA1 family monovalent cation:H+ antiporter